MLKRAHLYITGLSAAVLMGATHSMAAIIIDGGGNLYSQLGGVFAQTTPSLSLAGYNSTESNSGNPFWSGSSSSTYNFSNTGFSVGMAQIYGGDPTFNISGLGVEIASTGTVYFNVDVPTDYTAAGTYALAGSGSIKLFGELLDASTSAVLFDSLQLGGGQNGTLTLGGLADAGDVDSGSLTGALVPGDQYEWEYTAYIMNNLPSGIGGNGNIGVAFSAVPEPASLSLLGIGGLSLITRRKGRGAGK